MPSTDTKFRFAFSQDPLQFATLTIIIYVNEDNIEYDRNHINNDTSNRDNRK